MAHGSASRRRTRPKQALVPAVVREWRRIPLPRSLLGSRRPPGWFFQRHPVDFAEFSLQVLQVRLGGQLGTRGAPDDLFGQNLPSVPVHVLAEPAQQRREPAAPDVLEDGRVSAAGGLEELY